MARARTRGSVPNNTHTHHSESEQGGAIQKQNRACCPSNFPSIFFIVIIPWSPLLAGGEYQSCCIGGGSCLTAAWIISLDTMESNLSGGWSALVRVSAQIGRPPSKPSQLGSGPSQPITWGVTGLSSIPSQDSADLHSIRDKHNPADSHSSRVKNWESTNHNLFGYENIRLKTEGLKSCLKVVFPVSNVAMSQDERPPQKIARLQIFLVILPKEMMHHQHFASSHCLPSSALLSHPAWKQSYPPSPPVWIPWAYLA